MTARTIEVTFCVRGVISPLFSNIYMRRFVLGWKVLGYARRFEAEIVNYADDFAVLGRTPAAVMLAAVEALMKRLKLPMNAEKTRCCRLPEESMTFLGYRIGRNYRPDTGAAYIGTRPSRDSVRSICRRVSELTTPRDLLLPPGVVVARLNRLLTGWANYFILGQVSPAYAMIDWHATRRLRQWLCRKHKALGRARRAFRGRRHDLVREPDAGKLHVRFDERRLETESWRGVRHRHRRKPPATATPCAYRHRASRRLYFQLTFRR